MTEEGWYAEYRRVLEKRPRLMDTTWVQFDGGLCESMFVGTGWLATRRVYLWSEGKTRDAI